MGQSMLHLGSQGMTTFGGLVKLGGGGQQKGGLLQKSKTMEKETASEFSILSSKVSNALNISWRLPIATVLTSPSKSPAMVELTSPGLDQGLGRIGLVAGNDLETREERRETRAKTREVMP